MLRITSYTLSTRVQVSKFIDSISVLSSAILVKSTSLIQEQILFLHLEIRENHTVL